MSLRLNGSTSGYTEIDAPAVAANNTLTLPTTTNGSLVALDSSGRLGIGTVTPDALLTLKDSGDTQLTFKNSSGTTKAYIGTSGALGSAATDDLRIRSDGSNILFGLSGTERMRITSDGHALVGTTSSLNPANGFSLYYASLNSQLHIGHGNTAPNGNAYVVFSYNSGTIGTIVQNGTTGVTYNTSSDYRLKENVSPINDAIARVQQLKPSRFNFITEPDRIVDGFIAHEAQAVVPECVTGKKDAVDADGNPVYQGIDQSKLVPLLTAALQEAVAKIETLEARLTALEVTP